MFSVFVASISHLSLPRTWIPHRKSLLRQNSVIIGSSKRPNIDLLCTLHIRNYLKCWRPCADSWLGYSCISWAIVNQQILIHQKYHTEQVVFGKRLQNLHYMSKTANFLQRSQIIVQQRKPQTKCARITQFAFQILHLPSQRLLTRRLPDRENS